MESIPPAAAPFRPALPPAHPMPYGAADSLGILRHRWWVVAVAIMLGLAAAAAWARAQEPVWESTTSVLVHPAGHDTNVVGGRTQGQVNLDTEAQLVRSTAVAIEATELLEVDPLDPDELLRQVRVEVPPNTSVLVITFAAAAPAAAQAGSRAFAEAYLQQREAAAQADLSAQTAAIDTKIEELTASLADVNERFADTLPGSAAEANLESRRGTVTNQLNAMTSRRDELATATVTAGTVISEARLPSQPSQPAPALILASGAALGMVAGVGVAGLVERLARRVRRPADVSRRLGVPVLAAFRRATAPRGDEIASPYGPAGRAFDRLRNEVIAAERPPGSGTGTGRLVRGHSAPQGRGYAGLAGRVIVVTSASGGTTASLTAANLAASLSRSGHDVILAGARDTGDGALAALLGVHAAPGLSEVLSGRASLAEALQLCPRYPRMQVLTMGATATATGLLQSPVLHQTLATLAARARYVVVDAPPTSVSADAQSLASRADAALLVVELRRARLAGVADAVDQLHRVGTPLLGAVVVAPVRQGRDRDAAAQPSSREDRIVHRAAPRPRHEALDGQTLVMPQLNAAMIAALDRQPRPPAPPDEPPGRDAGLGGRDPR